jgi:hypothetical protein
LDDEVELLPTRLLAEGLESGENPGHLEGQRLKTISTKNWRHS